jgi:hypothetical protein
MLQKVDHVTVFNGINDAYHSYQICLKNGHAVRLLWNILVIECIKAHAALWISEKFTQKFAFPYRVFVFHFSEQPSQGVV